MDDELKALRAAARRHRLKILLWVGAFAALLALLPMILGLGLFGWKLFRYERVTLYVANGSGQEITVSIGASSSRRFSEFEVGAIELLAGEVHLVTRDANGDLLEEIDFETDNQDAFYSVAGAFCFAVMDASRLYHEEHPEDPIVMIDRLGPDDRIYLLPDGVFIRPRGIIPDTVPTGRRVTWIDDVSCQLLDPEDEHLLLQQQIIEMQERRERRREMVEQQRESSSPR